jgi:aspartate aminotransferase-like enzyme
MEAAISNTISPGDKVLCLVTGVFGERWAKIAEAYSAAVERVEYPAGKTVDVEQVASILAADKEKSIKAITVTHNETSTGVLNDLRQIAHLAKKHGALSIVDAVTSFGAINIPMDEWHIDIMVTGSQKALMLPPGLSIIFFGSRALAAQSTCKSPRFYLDLARYKKSLATNSTPFTPNVSFICALEKSLQLIQEEGILAVQARHFKLRSTLRTGLRSLGLKLFVDDDFCSPTITAILPPDKISVADIRKGLKEDFNIIVADGQESLQSKIFRIGHMGYVFERDILMTLACLESVLQKSGYKLPTQQLNHSIK